MANRRYQSGFTLIELLVVVAIISVLMAILLPSLGSAKHQAKTAACLANLRGIGVGLSAYTTDNNGVVLPWLIQVKSYSDNWVGLLTGGGYAKAAGNSTRSVFYCPEGIDREDSAFGWDVGSQKAIEGSQWLRKMSSDGQTLYKCNYALSCFEAFAGNSWWNSAEGYGNYFPARDVNDQAPYETVLHVTDVEQPSTTIYAFDGMDYLAFGDTKRINLRHGPDGRSATNFLCMDGHAQTLPQGQFPSDIDNFYSSTTCDNAQNYPLTFTCRKTGWH